MAKDLEKVYDHIIIGSGFGGSVSAMRLAEKGYDVLVLEMGKEYKAKDFPKNNWKLAKFFWSPMLRWFGFQRLTFFKNVFIESIILTFGYGRVRGSEHGLIVSVSRTSRWPKMKCIHIIIR